MEEINLYTGSDGRWVTNCELIEKLRSIGAEECDLLVVQTGVMFGNPNLTLGRKGYLAELYGVLQELHVDTLAVPTFTYSFCNHEDYDVRRSKTCLGGLAEYIRMRPEAKRSMDPLLSMVAIGKRQNMFDGDLGHNSLGAGSAYDRIHHTKNTKFLCFGSNFSEYFTYVHYVEKMLDVPYRFDVEFSGNIIDEYGNVTADTHSIHTACGKVEPAAFPQLRDVMVKKGTMALCMAGDAELICVKETDVYTEIVHQLDKNINYFLKRPFSPQDLTHTYKYGKNGERVTHC